MRPDDASACVGKTQLGSARDRFPEKRYFRDVASIPGRRRNAVLAQLRGDVSSRHQFVVSGAASAVHCIGGQKFLMGPNAAAAYHRSRAPHILRRRLAIGLAKGKQLQNRQNYGEEGG